MNKKYFVTILLFIFTTFIYSASITNGLISEWSWENNANDSQGTHHGTISGATFDTGISGQAVSIDGNDDYVKMTSGPDLRGLTSLTMTSWVNSDPNSGQNYSRVIEIGNDAGTSTAIVLDTNGGTSGNYIGTVRVWVHTNGSRKEVGTANNGDNYNYNDGLWHHLAMTYDGSQLKLYIDGVLTETGSATGSIDSEVGTLIGQHNFLSPTNSDTFGGLIDETLVYNRALSATEISTLAQIPTQNIPEPASFFILLLGLAIISWKKIVK